MWPQVLNSVGAGPSVPYTNQNGLQYEQKSSHTVMPIFDLRDVALLYKYSFCRTGCANVTSMPDHNGCSSVQGSLLPVLLPESGSPTPQTNQDTSGTMRRSIGVHYFLYYNLFLKEF